MTHTTVTAAEMKALEKAANDNGLFVHTDDGKRRPRSLCPAAPPLARPRPAAGGGGQGQQRRGRLRHGPGGRQAGLAGAGAAG